MENIVNQLKYKKMIILTISIIVLFFMILFLFSENRKMKEKIVELETVISTNIITIEEHEEILDNHDNLIFHLTEKKIFNNITVN
ncbi:MAG: hypothetical protein GY849_02645 [Deltaproteobacteria bacterium]|nr:hypothetical protein [Deltaproteobacteria bacterium]